MSRYCLLPWRLKRFFSVALSQKKIGIDFVPSYLKVNSILGVQYSYRFAAFGGFIGQSSTGLSGGTFVDNKAQEEIVWAVR